MINEMQAASCLRDVGLAGMVTKDWLRTYVRTCTEGMLVSVNVVTHPERQAVYAYLRLGY